METVSFEQWMIILRRAAKREEVVLSPTDADYHHYYNQGDTPRGALIDIVEFCD